MNNKGRSPNPGCKRQGRKELLAHAVHAFCLCLAEFLVQLPFEAVHGGARGSLVVPCITSNTLYVLVPVWGVISGHQSVSLCLWSASIMSLTP